jgi:ABC-type transport system substrate-binding protein
VSVTWIVGREAPRFDPLGPPESVRWSLERLLSSGLVEEDESGRIVGAAADSVRVSTDGLVYTFRLRDRLAFSDGRPCPSEEFRKALEQGIGRLDHGTHAWLLSALTGMEKFRPGRPLPELGIATPDPRTLVLRLSRPDSLLLRKLAIPGVATPWSEGTGAEWRDGIGEYRVVSQTPTGLELAHRGPPSGAPDTIHVRFVPGQARAAAMLREGTPDLLWPIPSPLLHESPPADYRLSSQESQPPRRLLLVLRADLPPTSKPAARHALAHALNRSDLVAALGASGGEMAEWLAGGEPFDFPKHDPNEVQAWLERGKLGRSLHVVMAYARYGVAAEVARPMQVEWARLGLDVELRPLSGAMLEAEALRYGGAQALLIDSQSLLKDPVADLATLVVPARGPAVGSFRSGWVTREFDRWIGGRPASELDVAYAQQRLAEEQVVLPLARLPWVWVERTTRTIPVHPRFGPDLRAIDASGLR